MMAIRRRHDRRGIVFPIVLVCCFLLATMVVTFQFISSSDYRHVGRLMRAAQASALADLASDEIMLEVGSISYGTGDAKPTWLDELLNELESARTGGGAASGTLDVKKTLDFTDRIPRTARAADLASKLVEVRLARVLVGPFEVAGRIDPELYYAEPAFNDSGKVRVPWTLRAPFSAEVAVASPDGGPLEFSQQYARSQDFLVTDTTPPAAEFALFGYMAPPSEEYALNDLQRGGRITVSPNQKGRVHLRGPLLLLPEESHAGYPWIGGDRPAAGSITYPDTYWTEWAAIPGPRELQHPESSGGGPLTAVLGRITQLLKDVLSDIQARRPKYLASKSKLETKPISIMGFDIPTKKFDLGAGSVVVASNLASASPSYSTLDQDEMAYYPPSAYLHAVLAPQKQTFQVLAKQAEVFRGMLQPGAAGGAMAAFDAAAAAPAEGDAVLLEPAPTTAGEAGVLGLYGVGTLNSDTWATMKLWDVGLWIVKKKLSELGTLARAAIEAAVGGADTITNLAFDLVDVDKNLDVMLRRFAIAGQTRWDDAPQDLTGAEVEAKLRDGEAVAAPYGFYQHADGFWASTLAPAGAQAELVQTFKTPLISLPPEQILNAVFIDDNVTDWNTVEAMATSPSPQIGQKYRDWLTGEHATHLVRNTAGSGAAGGDGSFRAILDGGLPGALQGHLPLSDARKKRPDGAFGDYVKTSAIPAAELDALRGAHPNGCFPPGFRHWEALVTRAYPDMAAYLQAEMVNGVLDLKGAVLIHQMSFGGGGSPQSIAYKGRGILICVTEDAAAPATLDAQIAPAPGQEATSELILVHRVSREVMELEQPPPLKLGPLFAGSVYSDTGVSPAGAETRIEGNLVTGLLNKRGVSPSMGPDEGVTVNYRDALADAAAGPRVPYWTVELGGEVSSAEPSS